MAAQEKVIQFDNINPAYEPSRQPKKQPRHVVKKRVDEDVSKKPYAARFLFLTVCAGIFSLMFLELYMASQINHVHYEIQQVQRHIATESSRNEQLVAEISVLSQHSRIIEIATRHGLIFDENNVININANR